ncbi:MAG: hypothetical protein HQL52_04740 [Magnetococcales bacterium]|nr:hypothetical protein [Magnetococcales bacterium]
MRHFFPRPGFRGQLFLIITAGVVGVSLITALTNAWLTTKRLRAIHQEQGLQVTGNLARQSVLALLYDSDSNAEEAVATTLAFPGIGYVALLNGEREVLLDQGQVPPGSRSPQGFDWPGEGPRMVGEEADHWHFMAPVLLNAQPEGKELGEESVFLKDASSQEMLGHVYVLMNKQIMQGIQQGIISNNLLTATVFTGLCLLLLHLLLGRLFRPLNALSQVMGRAETEAPQRCDMLEGPEEMVRIARVYNRMIEAIAERDRRLRQHNERLETEVEQRTHELVVARDIALESSRHKSEFLANMTHELRTPLQSVIGYADFVRETLMEEGLQECVNDLEKVESNAQRLLGMINEVLDYSKSEAGRMTVHLEKVDPRDLVHQAMETVIPALGENGNQWALDLDDQASSVLLDASKMRMILVNLLGNAAKFTKNGRVEVTLRQDDRQLAIQVQDSGIGMKPEHLAGIFEPFKQVDGSQSRLFQGTGLGLAVTKKFCQLLGGDVEVKSIFGKGSTFRVDIPLPVRPLVVAGIETADAGGGSISGKGEIL